MERKRYQLDTLATLSAFATRARAVGPHLAFAEHAPREPAYMDQGFGLTPYVCLRLPTGGGKSVLGADAIPLLRRYVEQDYPLTLWLVPSKAILEQTAATLRDPQHPYRERINAQFGIDRVRVLRLDEVTDILPQDLHQKALIVVTTTQALRVDKTDTRKVYAAHEDLDPTFARIEVGPGVAELERDADGQVLASFVNLCRAWRPLVIVDEAHNARTPLSFETLKRFSPAFILELTATPASGKGNASNVLARVSARELRDDNMIKLPVVVTEYGGDWRATIAGAVQQRAALETLAGQDGRGIRPMTLYQAERKDGEVTPEVIRDHLIAQENIPEEQIAIATGTQRGIEGRDLFARDCPIRHIITVQALKEGWDCAWAYVLCSVANIRSAKDIEQLLGRVLRMPNARASACDPLNRAYAHVTHGEFQSTAAKLKDALVTLGFDRATAREAIQTPFDFGDEDDLLAERRGASVTLPGPPLDLDGLPGDALDGIAITSLDDQATTVRIEPHASEEAVERLCARLPEQQREPVRQAHREARKQRCPIERGESLRIPLLAWRQSDLILGEATTAELRDHAGFSVRDCPPQDCAWTPTHQASSSEIDADESGSLRIGANRVQELTQTSLSEQMDRDWLIYWLARECRRADTTEADMIVFLTRWVAALEQQHGLHALMVHKFRLQARVDDFLGQCAAKAARRGLAALNGALLSEDAGSTWPFAIAAEMLAEFDARVDYRPTRPLRGRSFGKHLYPLIGEMNDDELALAVVLDSLPAVAVWLRNLDRHPRSFRLPYPSESGDWFYPDFLARLADGRVAAIEYKGKHLEPLDEGKRQIGLAWERAMGGKGCFVWIGDSATTAKGRAIAQQLIDALSNQARGQAIG